MYTDKNSGFGLERPNVGVNQILLGGSECCSGADKCQDLITFPSGGVVTSFNLLRSDGTTTTVNVTPASVSASDIQAAIVLALQDYEVGIMLAVTDDGTNVTVEHVGQSAIASVMVDGLPVLAVRSCMTATNCTYCATVSDTPGDVSYNAITAALAGSPYTDPSVLQADVLAALTAVGITGAVVTVTENTVLGGFNVKFVAGHGLDVKIGTKTFDETNCEVVFV